MKIITTVWTCCDIAGLFLKDTHLHFSRLAIWQVAQKWKLGKGSWVSIAAAGVSLWLACSWSSVTQLKQCSRLTVGNTTVCESLLPWKWKCLLVAHHGWFFATPLTVAPGLLCLWNSPARTLEWVAIPFSRESSWPRDQTRSPALQISCLTIWATREAPNVLSLANKSPGCLCNFSTAMIAVHLAFDG